MLETPQMALRQPMMTTDHERVSHDPVSNRKFCEALGFREPDICWLAQNVPGKNRPGLNITRFQKFYNLDAGKRRAGPDHERKSDPVGPSPGSLHRQFKIFLPTADIFQQTGKISLANFGKFRQFPELHPSESRADLQRQKIVADLGKNKFPVIRNANKLHFKSL